MRKWLVDIRESLKISQYESAIKCGISQSYYAAIESGKRGNPLPVHMAIKIGTAFGFDWKKFYEELDKNSKGE